MDNIISKFTDHLKNVLTRALTLVIEQKGQSIEPEHLLWALGTQQGSVGAEVLLKSGVVRQDLNDFVGVRPETDSGASPSKVPTLSDRSKVIIEKAVLTASTHAHKYIGTEHLLAGLIESRVPDIEAFLEDAQVETSVIEKNLESVFATTTQLPTALESKSDRPATLDSLMIGDSDSTDQEDDSKTPALDFFTQELTDTDVAANIDPVIGREKEIERLMNVVARRTKNNPILVGEPGVGKTAIVEGLAKRIVEGDVPPVLTNKHIHRLDLASLIAGTMYRGEFESRLKQLVEEIEEMPEVMLFIDEVHSIMGAGAASGSLDAANMLKPALARGSIRCIGATTPTEYKKFIETDGALERRFQAIRVDEPSPEKTRLMLNGIRRHYEDHHNVTYTDAAIESALRLSIRFLTDKQLPDKAIDLLDEAGARARVKGGKTQDSEDKEDLLLELDRIEDEKKRAVASELFEKAIELKEEETRIRFDLSTFDESSRSNRITITDNDIMNVVADITGISVKRLTSKERSRLRGLAKRLKAQVIGQDRIVEQVAQTIARAQLGLADQKKPLTSLLFIGPSGTGKTALGKAIASEVFHGPKAFLRLDMSEFSSAFTVSKLLGSPAGYVGYRESSLLTDHVKQHPHSVVLFDELEKAHPDVIHILLQILDEGELTDATGRTVSFRHTVVILTSNVGSELFEQSALGFEAADRNDRERTERVQELARERFSRELVNRIQHVGVFQQLSKKTIEAIAKKQLKELIARLERVGVGVQISPRVAKEVTKHVQQKHGARDITRAIETLIEHPLTALLLTNKTTDAANLSIEIAKTGEVRILHKK